MAKTKQAEARIADPLVRKPIVDWMLADIGVDPFESESHIRAYVDAVKQIESSGGWNTTGVKNKKTGNAPLGDFQWFPTPFKEDLKAAQRYYEKSDLDEPAWIEKALNHKDPRKLTSGQQEELFLIRMYRLADNGDLAKTYSGDNEAGRYIYATHHHTNPDADTIDLMDEYLPVPELPSEPEVKPEFEPRIESELAATHMATENGRFSEIQPQSSRVPEEYVSDGMLSEVTDLPTRRGGGEILKEVQAPQRSGRFPQVATPQRRGRFPEVTPTQRGQVPIPQDPPLEEVSVPERAGRFPEVSVDAKRRGGGEILEPIKVDPSKVDTTYERDVTPAKVENVYDAFMPTAEDEARIAESVKQGSLAVKARKAESFYDDFFPDVEDRPASESFEATQLRRGLRTTAQGLSSGTSDELEASLRALFSDTPYAEARAKIMEDINAQRVVSPTTALFQDIGGGVLGGGALVNQLVKRGASGASAGALEGALMGAGYGEGAEGKVASAAGFAAFGGTLGKAIDWATTPSSKAARASQEGGRTQIDDALDEEILTATIKNDVVPGNTVTYVTRAGQKKEVQVIAINDGTSAPKSKGGKFEIFKDGKREASVIVKDGSNQYAVPFDRIESVSYQAGRSPVGALKDAEKAGQYDYVPAGPGGRYQQKQFSYLEEGPIQEAKTKPRQKVLRPKRNEDGSYSLMPSGKVEWELQELTWRNAQTAGEFFDGVKYLAKDFYDQKLTPASDYVMRNVAPRVGAIFQRYSETALRENTIAFKTIFEPMEKLIKGIDDDKMLKAMIMDYTNQKNLIAWNNEVAMARAAISDSAVQLKGPLEQTITSKEDLLEYIARNYGNDQAIAFNRYLDWNKAKKADHVQRLSGVEEWAEEGVEHIHTRKMRKNPEDEPDDIIEELAMRDDAARKKRSRLSMVDNLADDTVPDKVDRYFNPILTDFRRTSNLEVLNQMARLFNLKRPAPTAEPTAVFDELFQTLITRGLSEEKAKIAVNAMKDDFIGQSKTPNNWLQFLNSWGYAGSLAGPKSALLNLHDIPMAAVIYGPASFKGISKKMGYKVTDKGITQNVGEFQNYVNEQMSLGAKDLAKQLADVARGGTDKLMRYSFFQMADEYGKQKITQMIIQDAVNNVDNLGARWGFYFSKGELDDIAKQIRRHGTDVASYTGKGAELMEELFFAGLGQQQLISSAGRPLAWSRNPNLRFMWALRGFAMKQLALAHRNIIDNIAQGNNAAAWEYMKRYALFSAGSFGLLNESRQWAWGDGEFTASGVIMGMADQIVSTASINTIGLNDYQWGKMMQEGVAITFIKSLEPLMTSVPRGNLGDVIDAIDGEFKNNKDLNLGQRLTLPASQFPLIKQWSNAVKNAEEDFGLIPDPMAQFNKVYIQQEQAE
jgi:uncharacterized protein YcfJ